MKRLAPLSLLLVLALLSTVACGEDGIVDAGSIGERQVRVVATTGMIADAVRHVGGERVDVAGLMGPGVDPHLYSASEGDVTRLREADIIFYNGLHLEAQMANVLQRMNESGARTVAVAEGVAQERLLAPAEFEGAYDPHVWFDVSMWMEVVKTVRDALVVLDEQNSEIYVQNAESYLAQLGDLHLYVLEQAQRVPEEQRVLVTAHDAFNYFGRAYGFEVRGLQGISTVAEASTADVQALARFIVEREIPAVFVESSVPQRNIEAVQAAVRAQGTEVAIGGALYSDAMGSPDTAAGEYMGMVRHNIDTIVSALLGQE